MEEDKKKNPDLDPVVEALVVETVGDRSFTVAVPEPPPPPLNPDDAIKAACERAAGGGREKGGEDSSTSEDPSKKKTSNYWLDQLAEADARLSAAAAAADLAVKQRIGNDSEVSKK